MLREFTVTEEDLNAALAAPRSAITCKTCILAQCFKRHGLENPWVGLERTTTPHKYFLSGAQPQNKFYVPEEAAQLADFYDRNYFDDIRKLLPLTFSMEIPE